MFTHRNNEKSNERGALMIEAIALLGLMTMMSPMIVRQTADRTSEMEEVTIAAQMKEIKDALNNWIEANYQAKAQSLNGAVEDKIPVEAKDLAPYLSATYLDGDSFRGNKLMDGFKVSVLAQCSEAAMKDGSPCESGTCYNMGTGERQGVVVPDTNVAECARYKMTGVVLSDSDQPIDDKRAARIATMIGADGGYMRTKNLVTSLFEGEEFNTEITKIVGAQGIWEGQASKFFDDIQTTDAGGRVAATTIYSSGFSGDYLYRKKVDGLPGANSMFTDLDMGGATECSADGCHKINNAGGLEVVGGQILIRSQNTADHQEISSGDSFARIALGTDSSHMHVTGSIKMTVGSDVSSGEASGGLGLSLTEDEGILSKGDTAIKLAGGDGGDIELKTDENMKIQMDGSTSSMLLKSSGTIEATSTGSTSLTAGTDLVMKATNGKIDVDAKNIEMESTEKTSLTAGTDLAMTAMDGTISANAKNIKTEATENTYIKSNTHTDIYGSRIRLAAGTEPENISSSLEATYLDLTGSEVDMIAQERMSLRAGSLGGTSPGVYVNTTEYSLGTIKSRVIGEGDTVSIEAYDTNATSSQFHLFDYSDSGKKTAMYVKPDVVAATVGKRKGSADSDDYPLVDSSYALSKDSFTLSIGMSKVLLDDDYVHHESAPPKFKLLAQDDALLVNVSDGTEENLATAAYLTSKIKKYGGMRVSAETGQMINTDIESIKEDVDLIKSSKSHGLVQIDIGADLDGSTSDITPYNTHQNEDKEIYNHFRIDPSYMSVMNDIKLTSRGGARLSEALPNYILKGIYELTNSYGAGPWPCRDPGDTTLQSNCTYKVPYYSKKELGVSIGGWDFHCGTNTNVDGTELHPVEAGGGSCDGEDGTKEITPGTKRPTVEFSQHASQYQLCKENMFCWAHPFMGIVPAPGRGHDGSDIPLYDDKGTMYKIDYNPDETEALYAYDEGPCPDGYQAVITVTPTIFELGKVQFVASEKRSYDAQVAYNPGWQNYAENDMTEYTGIMQQGTRLGMLVQPLAEEGKTQIFGWAVAMGTVTQVSSDINIDEYIWNVGGVPANSWTAIAHTYCYFNPNRFTMPNMRVKDNALQTMHNPDLYPHLASE